MQYLSNGLKTVLLYRYMLENIFYRILPLRIVTSQRPLTDRKSVVRFTVFATRATYQFSLSHPMLRIV